MIQVDKEEWLLRKRFGAEGSTRNDLQAIEFLRKVCTLYRPAFIQAAFCCLTGITLVVRGDPIRAHLLARGFCKLLPENFAHRIDLSGGEFGADKKIVFLQGDSIVPPASSKLCIVDCLINGTIAAKWSGELPSKLPDMLQKVVKFCDEKMFNVETLERQLQVLVHEWKK